MDQCLSQFSSNQLSSVNTIFIDSQEYLYSSRFLKKLFFDTQISFFNTLFRVKGHIVQRSGRNIHMHSFSSNLLSGRGHNVKDTCFSIWFWVTWNYKLSLKIFSYDFFYWGFFFFFFSLSDRVLFIFKSPTPLLAIPFWPLHTPIAD